MISTLAWMMLGLSLSCAAGGFCLCGLLHSMGYLGRSHEESAAAVALMEQQAEMQRVFQQAENDMMTAACVSSPPTEKKWSDW